MLANSDWSAYSTDLQHLLQDEIDQNHLIKQKVWNYWIEQIIWQSFYALFQCITIYSVKSILLTIYQFHYHEKTNSVYFSSGCSRRHDVVHPGRWHRHRSTRTRRCEPKNRLMCGDKSSVKSRCSWHCYDVQRKSLRYSCSVVIYEAINFHFCCSYLYYHHLVFWLSGRFYECISSPMC